mgnify:CR=1 FL=1
MVIDMLKLRYEWSNYKHLRDRNEAAGINKEIIDKDLEDLTLEIYKIEQDSEKAKTILKICCIYSSNNFENGLKIKTSRFNHSCQPNADSIQMLNNQYQVRAIGNIKAGEEINIDYNEDKFSGFRNRKHRQMSICSKWFFECSCELCNRNETNAFDDLKI